MKKLEQLYERRRAKKVFRGTDDPEVLMVDYQDGTCYRFQR